MIGEEHQLGSLWGSNRTFKGKNQDYAFGKSNIWHLWRIRMILRAINMILSQNQDDSYAKSGWFCVLSGWLSCGIRMTLMWNQDDSVCYHQSDMWLAHTRRFRMLCKWAIHTHMFYVPQCLFIKHAMWHTDGYSSWQNNTRPGHIYTTITPSDLSQWFLISLVVID